MENLRPFFNLISDKVAEDLRKSAFREKDLRVWPSRWRAILLHLKELGKLGTNGEPYRVLTNEMFYHLDEELAESTTDFVLNRYKEKTDRLAVVAPVTIMRPSPYGNPYSHQSNAAIKPQFAVATRDEAVLSYLLELRESRIGFIEGLRGNYLLCCCAPSLCHGHMLYPLANNGSGLTTGALIDEWLTRSLMTILSKGDKPNYLTRDFVASLEHSFEIHKREWSNPIYACKV